jgi:hypothetical protein
VLPGTVACRWLGVLGAQTEPERALLSHATRRRKSESCSDDVRVNVMIFGHFGLSRGVPNPLDPPPVQLLLYLFHFRPMSSVVVDVDRPA